MGALSLDKVWAYQQVMEKNRSNYEDTWEDISYTMNPWRGEIHTDAIEGGTHGAGLFDTTALRASMRFSSFLKNMVAPSTSRWLHLVPERSYEDNQELRSALDVTADRIMDALRDSNFDVAMGQAIRDLSLYSNSLLSVEEDRLRIGPKGQTFGGFVFSAHAIGTYWWKMDRSSRPLFVSRRFQMSIYEIEMNFPDKLPEHMSRKLGTDLQFEDEWVYQFVYYNHQGSWGAKGEKALWHSFYMVRTGDGNTPLHMLTELEGYDLCPFITSRYMAMPGEEYGSGAPGDVARADALSLNEGRRKVLEAMDLDLDKPLIVEEDNATGLDFGPGGTIVLTPSVSRRPEYLGSGAEYGVANQVLSEDRFQISAAFMEEQIIGKETQPRSAQESILEFERSMSQLAIPANRIESELLSPVVMTCMGIMRDAGVLEELEEAMETVEGSPRVSPVFVSPLFNALRQEQIRRMKNMIVEKAQLVEATGNPDFLIDIDVDEVNAFERRNNAQPAEIYKSQEEIDRQRQARQQAEARQQQLEQATQAAEGASKLAPVLRGGSSLAV